MTTNGLTSHNGFVPGLDPPIRIFRISLFTTWLEGIHSADDHPARLESHMGCKDIDGSKCAFDHRLDNIL